MPDNSGILLHCSSVELVSLVYCATALLCRTCNKLYNREISKAFDGAVEVQNLCVSRRADGPRIISNQP